jgi:uncharacterized paraquat-inducible protein A
MNENISSSPIPAPEAQTCRACGASIADARAKYCPRCGAVLQSENRTVSGLKIFGAICLGMIALLFGGAGACFLIITPFALSGGGSDSWIMLAVGLVGMTIAAACVFGIVKLVKR